MLCTYLKSKGCTIISLQNALPDSATKATFRLAQQISSSAVLERLSCSIHAIRLLVFISLSLLRFCFGFKWLESAVKTFIRYWLWWTIYRGIKVVISWSPKPLIPPAVITRFKEDSGTSILLVQVPLEPIELNWKYLPKSNSYGRIPCIQEKAVSNLNFH